MGDCFTVVRQNRQFRLRRVRYRGFKMNSTYTFHGIKYADADRFQMPREVKPWKGIKNALAYGYVCPMLMQDHPLMEVMIPHRYWPMDENCQVSEYWTQSLDPEAKTGYGMVATEVDSLQAHPLNRWRMKEII